MKAIAILIATLLLSIPAIAEECPQFESAIGVGFYAAAIEMDKGSNATKGTLLDLACGQASPDGKVLKTESDLTLCRAGYYKAYENKSLALECWAKWQSTNNK